ncbi:MAG: hypothetical protein ACRDZR_11130 [Acidimicrobiales bacterium]
MNTLATETAATPRHAARPAARAGRGSRSYGGVALLDGGAPGTSAVPGLTGTTGNELVLDGDGLLLLRPNGSTVRAAAWTEVAALAVADPSWSPDLGRGVTVDVTSWDRRRTRLFVPARRPGAVAARLRAVARRHRVDPGTPDRRVPAVVAVGVVAVSGALVTWLLLVAGHVVHH